MYLFKCLLFVMVVLALTPCTASAEAARFSDEVLAEIAAKINQAHEADEFSGVVLVAQDGEVLLQMAVGFARRETRVPNNIEFRYNIGSITKVFTRVLITQLDSEGRLDLHDTIAHHLTDYPDPEIAQKVTIQHLLDMSSGLGDIFGERYDATPKDEIMTLTDYLALFAGIPLEFEPGTSKRYSNAGYIVLGLIIEKLTGLPYHQAVAERVYKPAGMKSSASLARNGLPEDAAFGYTREGWMSAMEGGEAPTGEWRVNTDTLPGRGSSAGGTYSTARDLMAFNYAVEKGKLGDASYFRKCGGMRICRRRTRNQRHPPVQLGHRLDSRHPCQPRSTLGHDPRALHKRDPRAAGRYRIGAVNIPPIPAALEFSTKGLSSRT